MKKLYFATSNKNKLEEVKSILNNIEIEQIDIDLDEIQSIDVEEVSKHKIIQGYKETNLPVLVEDTGLYINYFNGFPGALIKWMLKSIDNKGIIEILKNKKDLSAKAVTVAGFYNGKDLIIEKGEINGRISLKCLGDNGFGWDKIFIPEGYNKTFAEMTEKEKNLISMRKIAFEKIKNKIK